MGADVLLGSRPGANPDVNEEKEESLNYRGWGVGCWVQGFISSDGKSSDGT